MCCSTQVRRRRRRRRPLGKIRLRLNRLIIRVLGKPNYERFREKAGCGKFGLFITQWGIEGHFNGLILLLDAPFCSSKRNKLIRFPFIECASCSVA